MVPVVSYETVLKADSDPVLYQLEQPHEIEIHGR